MSDEIDPCDECVDAVRASVNILEERELAPYDGIKGFLPEWVPEPICEDFRRERNRILDTWGFEIEEALEWLNFYLDTNNLGEIPIFPVVAPSGLNINLDSFEKSFSTLARIKNAKGLGAKEGIKLLSGDLV